MRFRRLFALLLRTSIVAIGGCNAIVGTRDIDFVDPAPAASVPPARDAHGEPAPEEQGPGPGSDGAPTSSDAGEGATDAESSGSDGGIGGGDDASAASDA